MPAVLPTFAACPHQSAHEIAIGGPVLATIRGTSGTSILAGRTALVVCGCSLRDGGPVPAGSAWSYDRLVRLSVERSGSLEILSLVIPGAPEALPLIALDPHGVAAAMAAIDRVQHLVDDDRATRAVASVTGRDARASDPAAPRLAAAGLDR
jgi:hypothetical protein